MTVSNTDTIDAREQLTALDLFSGCGGLTLGLKEAGYSVLGAVDIEPLSNKTYRANHEDVTVWEIDIRNLEPADVAKVLRIGKGDLDLLAGCPPCQGFSALRTLNGSMFIDDPGNDLLFDFLRFVEALQPRAVMMENVPGLAQDERFEAFCSRMREIGYLGRHKRLNAAEYGVPQRRWRLIYLAGFQMQIPFAKGTGSKVTVKTAIADLPKAGESGDDIHDIPEKRSDRIKELIRMIPKDGGSRTNLPAEYQLPCHKRCSGFKDVYGRMSWNDVAPTLTSGCFNPSKGRFLHPQEDRAITMREAAVLQGFPPDYRFPTTKSKSALALMIGNALPPPFIAAHAGSVRDALLENAVSRISQEDECRT